MILGLPETQQKMTLWSREDRWDRFAATMFRPAANMTKLTLQDETKKLTNKIREQVVGFEQEDPLRTWFTVELDAIGVWEDTDELSLDEANACVEPASLSCFPTQGSVEESRTGTVGQ